MNEYPHRPYRTSPISFSKEFIAAYPEAKVILTVRDNEDVWHESLANTIWTGRYLFSFPKSPLQPLIHKIAPRPEAWRTVQYAYEYTIKENFPTRDKQNYLEHNAKIKTSVPKERLLKFNVKQGCGRQCEFLGVPVPDRPFPRISDTKAWQAHVAKAKTKAAMNAVKALAVLGVVVVECIWPEIGWGQ
jgi:hypothetical protein